MSGIWKRIVAIIAANKTVAAISGWGSWFVSSFLYDDVLYPLAIAYYGPLTGGLTMAAIAIIYTYFWTRQIVASDKDWFSMDKLHKVQRAVFWVVRVAKHIPFMRQTWVDKVELGMTFLALNIITDPMIATLYYRRDDHSVVLSLKDKKIFAWSCLVANGYWILRSWGMVALILTGWEYLIDGGWDYLIQLGWEFVA